MTQTNITDEASTLLAQFEQWAKIEPDRCTCGYVDSIFILRLRLRDTWLKVSIDEPGQDSGVGRAIVQAVVQEAIAAHNWLYQIGNAITGHCYAQVLKPANHKSFHGQADEPAIALLSAHLSALQAEQGA
jgi:hypothetical protein